MSVPLDRRVYKHYLNFSVTDILGWEHIQFLGQIDVLHDNIFEDDFDLS